MLKRTKGHEKPQNNRKHPKNYRTKREQIRSKYGKNVPNKEIFSGQMLMPRIKISKSEF